MNPLAEIWRRLRFLLRRNRLECELEEEMRFHLEMKIQDNIKAGMSPEEARRAARLQFGNSTLAKEDSREFWGFGWLDRLWQDLRYGTRALVSNPAFAIATVLSLALGIGFNTAIFSVADQVLFRSLPIEDPGTLVQLHWNGRFVINAMGNVGIGSLVPYPLYRELRAENEVFADMLGRAPAEVHLAIGNESEPASVELVTGSYFTTLGITPALGRLLTDADDLQEDAHPVVVLSYDYWRSRAGGDPGIVGTTVRINGYPMTVVGVAEQGFRGMDWIRQPALFVPMAMKARATPPWSGLKEYRARFMHAFGRLKPGVSREQAQAALQPWFQAYLRADMERAGWPQLTERQTSEYLASRLELLPGGQGDTLLRRYLVEKPLLILMAATSLILLLACLNVANLSLARVVARRRATALRTALGASNRRIMAEQLIESGMLATAGCLAGVLLAAPLIRVLLSFLPRFFAAAPALTADLDTRVLVFAVAIAVLTTLLSGAAPAFYAASVQPVTALKEQATSIAGGLGFRKALVVGQFALALILLIGAGLFARTLGTLRAEGPGFPTANLLMFRLAPLNDGYTVAETKPLVRRVLEEVRALPEVEHVGALRMEMLGGVTSWGNSITVASDRRITTESVGLNAVTPGLFQAIGTPIVRGRDFNERDSRDDARWAQRSAIVNEEFVKQYIPNADPVGARLGVGGRPDTVTRIEIVGVVRTFQSFRLREPEPMVFFSLWETGVDGATFYVRSRGFSEAAARSIRTAVRRVDAALAVLSLRTLDDQLDRLLIVERMLATLAAAFAGLATLLAMVGLCGLLWFSAARRTKEIGIRLALGARPWSAAGLIVREAALLALIGALIGLPASWALGRLIESQLYGVRPMDVGTIASAAALLALVCLAASALPARKAGTVNPLDALRSE